ncbi:MAG: DUF1631 family protein [Candidatus Thiodiazotropha sp.]
MSNRRKFPRLETDQPAILHFDKLRFKHCRVRNYSQGGIYLSCADPRIGSHLPQGYFQAADRAVAELELPGPQIRVSVSLVYVRNQGIGMCFLDEEQGGRLYYFLQSGVRGAVSAEPDATPQGAAHHLLWKIEQSTLSYLQPRLVEFFKASREALLQSMQRPAEDAEESAKFFAVTLLERESKPIMQAFTQQVVSALRSMPGEARDPTEQSQASIEQELELMEKQAFERWVVVSATAKQVENGLAPLLQQIEAGLSFLLGQVVKPEHNPLSPHALLEKIGRVLSGYELSASSFSLIIKVFRETLLRELDILYGQILQQLRGQGIDPQPLAMAPVNPDSPHLGSDRAEPGLPPVLQLGVLQSQPPASIGQRRVSPQTVSRFLENLPLRQGASLIKQLERQIPETELDLTIRAAVGTGEELVAALSRDPLLPGSIRSLLSRLKVPIVQAIVADPRLMENPDHPVRRLLSACESLIPFLWVHGHTAIPQKLRLEHLIDELDRGELEGLDEVRDALDVIRRELAARFRTNLKVAVARCVKQERQLLSEQRVMGSLQQLLLGRTVSPAMDLLFRYGWINLLIQTHTLKGESSAEWKAYWQVLEILPKLFSRDPSPSELPDHRLDDLIAVIRKGFREYPVHPEASRQYVSDLQQALRQHAGPLMTEHQQPVTINQAYLDSHGSWTPSCDQPLRLHEQTSPLIKRIDAMQVGDWLLAETSDRSPVMFNLAWKNPATQRYLWVDGQGLRLLDTTREQLLQGFAETGLRVHEEFPRPIVDRAIDYMLQDSYNSLKDESACDALTGLMNRRSFEQQLRKLLQTPGRATGNDILILLDLDQFQVINDLCGFEGGDILLQTVASILSSDVPGDGLVARIGDDEFVLLIPDVGLEQGYQYAESQRRAIEEYPFSWQGRLIPVSTSVGVLQLGSLKKPSPDTLLQAVLSACRIAKQAGRNCTRVFALSDSAYQHHQEMIQAIPTIQEALKHGRMRLFAQPIVPLDETRARQSRHFEVLLRVVDDQGRLQSPQTFITIAEQYDLMRAVDRWVVERFFATLADYSGRIDADTCFSVNLSAKSIADREFRNFLGTQIKASPIPARQLGFEVTETALARDISEIAGFVQEIIALGCDGYLDDFGSGYASFSYLRDLPVTYVKIDGVFVRDMCCKPEDRAMVSTITELAHFMGKRVVAEFVTDEATSQALRDMGVDYAQGYHFGKPRLLSDQLDGILQQADADRRPV